MNADYADFHLTRWRIAACVTPMIISSRKDAAELYQELFIVEMKRLCYSARGLAGVYLRMSWMQD
jgi:hypothetical protein